MRNRRPRPLIDRLQSHLGHQPPHPLAANCIALAPQMPGHLARAIPRRLQDLPVDQPHQRKVQRRLSGWLVIEPRSADRDQFALPHDREFGVLRLNHPPPPLNAHRPEALAKKSRSAKLAGKPFVPVLPDRHPDRDGSGCAGCGPGVFGRAVDGVRSSARDRRGPTRHRRVDAGGWQ